MQSVVLPPSQIVSLCTASMSQLTQSTFPPGASSKPNLTTFSHAGALAAGPEKAEGEATRTHTVHADENDKCPSCETRGRRNLVICIDGTSNQFSKKNTNVVELYSRLVKDDNQLTFYNSGIGTYAEPSWKSWDYRKQVIMNKLDLAFALRFEKIILGAYAWLVDHYEAGDQIFCFGFSRGAYQVRALAAMIETVGLLHKGNSDQIPFAYELYAASARCEVGGDQPLEADKTGDDSPSTHVATQSVPSGSAEPPLAAQSSPGAESTAVVAQRPLALFGRIIRRFRARASSPDRGHQGFVTLDSASDLHRSPPRERVPTQSSGFAEASSVLDEWGDEQSESFDPTWFPQPKRRAGKFEAQAGLRGADDITMQQRFKETFSRSVKVHFIGAWDTVSSVGFIRDKTLPGTTDGMKSVCYFRHALALHEYRVKFLPEYANGGDGPGNEETTAGDDQLLPHTKEVWFSGSHSDIGGGNAANTTLDRFGPSLRWMSFEAVLAGLRIENGPRAWEPIQISKSLTPTWWLIECMPIKRLSYRDRRSTISWPPPLGARRRIRPGQLVHETVLEECVPLPHVTRPKTEVDAYSKAQTLLHSLRNSMAQVHAISHLLETLWSSPSGSQSLLDLKEDLLRAVFDRAMALNRSRQPSSSAPARMKELRLLHDSLSYDSLEAVRKMGQLQTLLGTSEWDPYETFPFALHGHEHLVSSVAFISPSLVVSCSYDNSAIIWSLKTGEAVETAVSQCWKKGHCNCVATAPEGNLIAISSDDNIIRIWTHADGRVSDSGICMRADALVLSLAFSSDGSRVVSGSIHGILCVWNTLNGEPIGRAQHFKQDTLWSVAFCPTGNCVASGSADGAIRIWDARTLQLLSDTMSVRMVNILSLAFSPDGRSIASASNDRRIRVWDTETRSLRHTIECLSCCVAFSPTGMHLAAGSSDLAVRIWDVATGDEVAALKGHTRPIFSLSFSPDGTRIAPGSPDRTVRVWDRIPAYQLKS